MNDSISENCRLPMCENGTWNDGSRCSERFDSYPTYFTQQRIAEYVRGGVSSTLMSRDYKSATDIVIDKSQRKYIVRRLTPTECASLQGMPKCWCEGLEGSDSAKYKAYGNGLALPCAYDVLNRIVRFVMDD